MLGKPILIALSTVLSLQSAFAANVPSKSKTKPANAEVAPAPTDSDTPEYTEEYIDCLNKCGTAVASLDKANADNVCSSDDKDSFYTVVQDCLKCACTLMNSFPDNDKLFEGLKKCDIQIPSCFFQPIIDPKKLESMVLERREAEESGVALEEGEKLDKRFFFFNCYYKNYYNCRYTYTSYYARPVCNVKCAPGYESKRYWVDGYNYPSSYYYCANSVIYYPACYYTGYYSTVPPCTTRCTITNNHPSPSHNTQCIPGYTSSVISAPGTLKSSTRITNGNYVTIYPARSFPATVYTRVPCDKRITTTVTRPKPTVDVPSCATEGYVSSTFVIPGVTYTYTSSTLNSYVIVMPGTIYPGSSTVIPPCNTRRTITSTYTRPSVNVPSCASGYDVSTFTIPATAYAPSTTTSNNAVVVYPGTAFLETTKVLKPCNERTTKTITPPRPSVDVPDCAPGRKTSIVTFPHTVLPASTSTNGNVITIYPAVTYEHSTTHIPACETGPVVTITSTRPGDSPETGTSTISDPDAGTVTVVVPPTDRPVVTVTSTRPDGSPETGTSTISEPGAGTITVVVPGGPGSPTGPTGPIVTITSTRPGDSPETGTSTISDPGAGTVTVVVPPTDGPGNPTGPIVTITSTRPDGSPETGTSTISEPGAGTITVVVPGGPGNPTGPIVTITSTRPGDSPETGTSTISEPGAGTITVVVPPTDGPGNPTGPIVTITSTRPDGSPETGTSTISDPGAGTITVVVPGGPGGPGGPTGPVVTVTSTRPGDSPETGTSTISEPGAGTITVVVPPTDGPSNPTGPIVTITSTRPDGSPETGTSTISDPGAGTITVVVPGGPGSSGNPTGPIVTITSTRPDGSPETGTSTISEPGAGTITVVVPGGPGNPTGPTGPIVTITSTRPGDSPETGTSTISDPGAGTITVVVPPTDGPSNPTGPIVTITSTRPDGSPETGTSTISDPGAGTITVVVPGGPGTPTGPTGPVVTVTSTRPDGSTETGTSTLSDPGAGTVTVVVPPTGGPKTSGTPTTSDNTPSSTKKNCPSGTCTCTPKPPVCLTYDIYKAFYCGEWILYKVCTTFGLIGCGYESYDNAKRDVDSARPTTETITLEETIPTSVVSSLSEMTKSVSSALEDAKVHEPEDIKVIDNEDEIDFAKLSSVERVSKLDKVTEVDKFIPTATS